MMYNRDDQYEETSTIPVDLARAGALRYRGVRVCTDRISNIVRLDRQCARVQSG